MNARAAKKYSTDTKFAESFRSHALDSVKQDYEAKLDEILDEFAKIQEQSQTLDEEIEQTLERISSIQKSINRLQKQMLEVDGDAAKEQFKENISSLQSQLQSAKTLCENRVLEKIHIGSKLSDLIDNIRPNSCKKVLNEFLPKVYEAKISTPDREPFLKGYLLNQLVNVSLSDQHDKQSNIFFSKVYKYVEESDSKDLRDQKKLALSAVKQMYDYIGSNDKKNLHQSFISKVLSDTSVDRTISIPPEISALVHMYTTDMTPDKISSTAFDMTKSQITSEMSSPVSYMRSLSDIYEREGILKQRISHLDSPQATELRESLHSDANANSYLKQPSYDNISNRTFLSSTLTTIQSGITAISGNPEQNILPGQDNKVNEIFSSLNEKFADQTVLIAKTINNLLHVLKKDSNLVDDRWYNDNIKDIDLIKSYPKKFVELDIKRDFLLQEYKSGQANNDRKLSIAKELKAIQIEKCHMGQELAESIRVISETVPNTKNVEIIESMLLVKLSNESVVHYQGILEKIKQEATHLFETEEVASLKGTTLEAVMNQISGMVSEMLVAKLPEMLNSDSILQLEGYMNRFERRHDLQKVDKADIEESRTFLQMPGLSQPSLSELSRDHSFKSVIDLTCSQVNREELASKNKNPGNKK